MYSKLKICLHNLPQGASSSFSPVTISRYTHPSAPSSQKHFSLQINSAKTDADELSARISKSDSKAEARSVDGQSIQNPLAAIHIKVALLG